MVLGVEEKKLADDGVGHEVVDAAPQEHDPLPQQQPHHVGLRPPHGRGRRLRVRRSRREGIEGGGQRRREVALGFEAAMGEGLRRGGGGRDKGSDGGEGRRGYRAERAGSGGKEGFGREGERGRREEGGVLEGGGDTEGGHGGDR